MGWQSSVVLVVLAFAILFALLNTSHQLNYAMPHDPQIIPTEPLVSQVTVIEIVEREYRERVQHYQEAYLHVQYYNYSEGMEEAKSISNISFLWYPAGNCPL